MSSLKILNTTINDLDFIYYLFEEAIKYQKNNNYNTWNGFDKDVLINDINTLQQYKIIENNEILCIFSVIYNDKVIWREKDINNAIYLHRVVVNPKHKGKKMFQHILNWSINHALQKNINLIRLDTFGENTNIVSFYKDYGFKFIEYFTTSNSKDLPIQNRRVKLASLEYLIP